MLLDHVPVVGLPQPRLKQSLPALGKHALEDHLTLALLLLLLTPRRVPRRVRALPPRAAAVRAPPHRAPHLAKVAGAHARAEAPGVALVALAERRALGAPTTATTPGGRAGHGRHRPGVRGPPAGVPCVPPLLLLLLLLLLVSWVRASPQRWRVPVRPAAPRTLLLLASTPTPTRARHHEAAPRPATHPQQPARSQAPAPAPTQQRVLVQQGRGRGGGGGQLLVLLPGPAAVAATLPPKPWRHVLLIIIMLLARRVLAALGRGRRALAAGLMRVAMCHAPCRVERLWAVHAASLRLLLLVVLLQGVLPLLLVIFLALDVHALGGVVLRVHAQRQVAQVLQVEPPWAKSRRTSTVLPAATCRRLPGTAP